MKKKSKIILVLLILVIIVLFIVSFVVVFEKDNVNRVSTVYNKLKSSYKFTFSLEEANVKTKYKITEAQRGADISTDIENEDMHTTTLVLDEHGYYISHNEEKYYDYGDDEIDADLFLVGLKEASEMEYIHGTDEIDGKTYYYEEFDDISTFSILLNPTEDSILKTRFYFDGEELKYIKNTVNNEETIEEELLKVTVEYDADDGLFEIPEDYDEI